MWERLSSRDFRFRGWKAAPTINPTLDILKFMRIGISGNPDDIRLLLRMTGISDKIEPYWGSAAPNTTNATWSPEAVSTTWPLSSEMAMVHPRPSSILS